MLESVLGVLEAIIDSFEGKGTYFLGLLTALSIQIMTFCYIHNKITFDCSVGSATTLYRKRDQRLV